MAAVLGLFALQSPKQRVMNRLPLPPFVLIRAVFLFVIFFHLLTTGWQARADEEQEVAKRVLQSIALVVVPSPDPKAASSIGTGFCVWSTSTQSYFLTNYHVVKNAGFSGDKAEVLIKLYDSDNFFDVHMLPRRPFDENAEPEDC